MTALKVPVTHNDYTHSTRLRRIVCSPWRYLFPGHANNVSRLILLTSVRASLTFQLRLFVSPRVEDPPTLIEVSEKGPGKIHGKPDMRNLWDAECPNTLENVCATFSRIIILKCSGWLTMSTVNSAYYTSKLLQNAAELSGSFSKGISIRVATIWWQVQLEQHGGDDSGVIL